MSKTPAFLKKVLTDERYRLASDRESAAEFSGYVDTGVYLLNLLLSGSLFGGFPNNKVLTLCGESTVGKTYYAMSMVGSFLTQHPTGMVVYLDTEAAISRRMFEGRGIDSKRVVIATVDTVEQFRTKMFSLLESYAQEPEDERTPLLLVLDSLGILSTEKEMKDTKDGEFVKDMTRAGAVRATFRVLRLKLAHLKVPLIVVSHSYTQIGAYGSPQTLSGGGGIKYASDIIVMLSRKQGEKNEDGELTSVIITAKLDKSRFTREKKKVETCLSYSTGLDRYYGVADLGLKVGLLTQEGRSYKFPDGSKTAIKTVDEQPDQYFTEAFLKQLEPLAAPLFLYNPDVPDEDEA